MDIEEIRFDAWNNQSLALTNFIKNIYIYCLVYNYI